MATAGRGRWAGWAWLSLWPLRTPPASLPASLPRSVPSDAASAFAAAAAARCCMRCCGCCPQLARAAGRGSVTSSEGLASLVAPLAPVLPHEQ